MNLRSFFRSFLSVIVLALAGTALLHGQDATPFTMDKQFSADQLITTKNGTMITNKMFMDNGRVRTEMNVQGMNRVSIALPDQQKFYMLMPDQKMAMVMPYDPAKLKKQMAAAAAFTSKFDLVGPETVEGVACNKYKGVSSDNKTYFVWADAARKIPVKMMAEDGSFTVLWKNYVAGPQDAALFEIPSGYQTMTLPAMPGPVPGQ